MGAGERRGDGGVQERSLGYAGIWMVIRRVRRGMRGKRRRIRRTFGKTWELGVWRFGVVICLGLFFRHCVSRLDGVAQLVNVA